MKKNKLITYIIGIIILGIITVLTVNLLKSGIGEQGNPADKFAKCLTEKGTTLYTTYWCPHCTDQKALFGGSLKHLNVIECDPKGENAEPQKCQGDHVSSIPAWKFSDGTMETGVHTFEQLAEITGCQSPEE